MLLSECSYAHDDKLEKVQNAEIISIMNRYLDNLRSSVDDYSDKNEKQEIQAKMDIVASYLPTESGTIWVEN